RRRARPHPGIDARGALCARRSDRRGAVVERRSDRVVEPLHRTVRRQRPRLHRDLRRDVVLLRRAGSRAARHDRTGSRAMKRRAAVILAISCASGAALLQAQGRGGAEWTTSGYDAQRTAWVKTDPRISPASMVKPGAFGSFKFLWKLKLEYDPKA